MDPWQELSRRMKRKATRALVRSLGHPDWVPTEQDRENVGKLKFNGVSHPTIADYIGCSVEELELHFHHELGVGQEHVGILMQDRLFQIAKGKDTASATKILMHLMQAKYKAWRVPAPGQAGNEEGQKSVESLSLEDLEKLASELLQRKSTTADARSDEDEVPQETSRD